MRDSWTRAVSGVRADALDCLQTTFSLVADHAHGSGTHLGLGARCGFRLRQDGTLVATLADRLAEAEALLGVRVQQRWEGVAGPRLRRLAADGPLYVVADAYRLPWCPYADQQHLTHSFLVLPPDPDRVPVVDAYHNDTPWGAARPGVWELATAELDAAVAPGATVLRLAAGPPPPIDVPAALAATAAGLREAAPAIERYLELARARADTVDGLDRLVLDAWLLARERSLHAAWLAGRCQPGPGTAAAAAQAQAWQRLATHSYLALRRARRGRPAGRTIVDELAGLLDGDATTADRLVGEAGSPVRAAVHAALRVALQLTDEVIDSAPTLRDLPGFDSFRLAEVIEQVERQLAVELPPDRLAPGNLRDVAGLCRMFTGAPPPGSRP